MRRSDYHILTVGLHTYTSDNRFSASSSRVVHGIVPGHGPLDWPGARAHGLTAPAVAAASTGRSNGATSVTEGPEDWMLQIRNVAKSDAGEYECQINTQHPLVSVHVTLDVLGEFGSESARSAGSSPPGRPHDWQIERNRAEGLRAVIR